MLLGALLAGPLPNGNICDLVAWPPTSYECCRENRFRIQSNSIPQRETNGKFYWGDGHFVTIKLQAFFSPFAPSKAKRTPCGLPFLRDLFLTCVNYNNRQTFVFWTWSDEAAFDCFYSTTWLSGYNTSIRQRRKVSVAKAVQENKGRSWLPDGTSMLCTGNQTEH